MIRSIKTASLTDTQKRTTNKTKKTSDSKSLCVCDLEEILELKQSKLSYHLKKLVDANILSAEKHGTWNYYKINEQQIQVVLNEDTC